jgi:hypothetical protein
MGTRTSSSEVGVLFWRQINDAARGVGEESKKDVKEEKKLFQVFFRRRLRRLLRLFFFYT